MNEGNGRGKLQEILKCKNKKKYDKFFLKIKKINPGL